MSVRWKQPERALLEQLEPRLALRPIPQRPAPHVRVLADQELHVLLHLLDQLHLEPDVVEPRPRRVLRVVVR